MAERRTAEDTDLSVGYSIGELEFWDREWEFVRHEVVGEDYVIATSGRQKNNEILLRVRHRVFTLLCSWERQLSYTSINQTIFERAESHIDALLARQAPGILDAFNAAMRRLAEAAAKDIPADESSEELAQAITSCRRILKFVADLVYPPTEGTDADGHLLDGDHYRNRIKEYTKEAVKSESLRGVLAASIDGLFDRFASLDKLANKGVHAAIARREAEYCAIQTYLLAGELLTARDEAALSADVGDGAV
jgi:hypothetical protein